MVLGLRLERASEDLLVKNLVEGALISYVLLMANVEVNDARKEVMNTRID